MVKQWVGNHVGFAWAVIWTGAMTAAGYGLVTAYSDQCPGRYVGNCTVGGRVALVFFLLVFLLLWTYGVRSCLRWWRPEDL